MRPRRKRWPALPAGLAAGRVPAPPDVARRYGLSMRQSQRLCAAAGIARSPGRPRGRE